MKENYCKYCGRSTVNFEHCCTIRELKDRIEGLIEDNQKSEDEILRLKTIIDSIEDWAIVDFADDLLRFIRCLKSEKTTEDIEKKRK